KEKTLLALIAQIEGLAARAGLRLVYRGLGHSGPPERQDAAGEARSMNEVRTWLERIGLARYVDAFEANEIDMGLLKQVDDQMLKDIGVAAAGHRLRLRNAIAKLAQASAVDVKAIGG